MSEVTGRSHFRPCCAAADLRPSAYGRHLSGVSALSLIQYRWMPQPEPAIAVNGGRPTASLKLMAAASASSTDWYFLTLPGSTSMSIQIALTARAAAADFLALILPQRSGSSTSRCSERTKNRSLVFWWLFDQLI